MFDSIAWLDVVALVLLLVLGVFGAVKGAVRTAVSLVAGLLGVVAASRYGEDIGAASWPLVRDMDNADSVGVGLGCAVVFTGVLVAGIVVAWLLRKIVERAELGTLDRVLGLLVGFAKGALAAMLIGLTVMAFDLGSLADGARASVTMDQARGLFNATRYDLPDGVEAWLDELFAREFESQLPDGSR